MKATPALKNALIKNYLKNVWQRLHIILFTILLNAIPTFGRSYLLAHTSDEFEN